MANQRPGSARPRRSEVFVHVDRGELVVVEAGAAHGFAIQAETQRFDEMELAAGVGGQADEIAGVGRDFRLEDTM